MKEPEEVEPLQILRKEQKKENRRQEKMMPLMITQNKRSHLKNFLL